MNNNDFILNVIRAVKKNECLYNIKCPQYTEYEYKEHLWATIGKELGKSGCEIKKKWKSLRDCYKKYRDKAIGEGEIRKKYKYADELRFLDNYSVNRPYISLTSHDGEVSTDLSSDDECMYQPPLKETKLNCENSLDDMQEFLDEPLVVSSTENDNTSNIDAHTINRFSISVENERNLTMQQNESDNDEHPHTIEIQGPGKDLNICVIDEVRKYECIFNLQSPRYKHFSYKAQLWYKIGKRVGLSANDAKRKWKSVRDSYKRSKQKVGFGKPYKYADSLKFLDDFAFGRVPFHSSRNSHEPEVSTDLSSDDDILLVPLKDQAKNSFEQSFEDMQEFLEKPQSSEKFENLASLTVDPKSVTFRLFMILANKINEADLTTQERNDIEFAVSSVVYSKLSECNKKRANDI